MIHPVLSALGLRETESGGYLGHGEWSTTRDAGVIEPLNPSTGEVLGRVMASSQADYELLMERAQAAFKVWRNVPAPKRGEAIRLCADALRANKDALGSLVALEMGKIKAEGDGEVQEMIDIGEFAVGLSRQLYGLTMHSERPGHRMYEQYHPLGMVGVISAFNFPVAVWAWNSFPGRRLRRHHHLEALAEDPAVGDRLDEDLQRGAAGRRFPGHLLPVQRRRHRAGAGLRRRPSHPADQLHRLDRGRPHRSASASRAAWVARCSNWAATTPSSSTTAPT